MKKTITLDNCKIEMSNLNCI